MYQLSRLLHDQLRKLYDHLESHEVTPQLFAAPWFLTMFASQFPLSFVVRVFGKNTVIFCIFVSFNMAMDDSFPNIVVTFETMLLV